MANTTITPAPTASEQEQEEPLACLICEVDWYEGEDGEPPLASVQINGFFDTKELTDLITELQRTRAGMFYHMATYLHTSESTKGCKHLVRKSDYERDANCKMLCGRQQPESNYVYPLLSDPQPFKAFMGYGSGYCLRCMTVWQRENAQAPVGKSEGAKL